MINNTGQVFYVPKYAVEGLLPFFLEGLNDYLEKQEKVPDHKQQSAYWELKKREVSDDEAAEWLATLLVAPLMVYIVDDKIGNVSIAAFAKYYSKAWKIHTPESPRNGLEATIRIIRIFFDSLNMVYPETKRINYSA